jgi:hypothetical protein
MFTSGLFLHASEVVAAQMAGCGVRERAAQVFNVSM